MRGMSLAFLLICATEVAAQESNYSVDLIPADLKENANAVVRFKEHTFTIESRSHSRVHVRYATTILNDKAKEEAIEIVGYDRNSKITNFKGSLYDASGKILRKLKASDIYDQSAYDGFSLYSDNRFKRADLTHTTYPYTVEYEYEVDQKYLYSIDNPGYLRRPYVSTQQITYSINYPQGLEPRYKLMNINLEPEKLDLGKGLFSYRWVIKDLKPLKPEPFGPDFDDCFPRIMAAPSVFEYEGYTGDMSSWAEYGKWNYSLATGRDVLPEETKQKLREITRSCTTDTEKARVLYEYLQSRTRYVSIQLGIGGFQPFPASTVDKTGYGDCKALSNYMVALLREVGVKGYYTIVQAGPDEHNLVVDFPSHQFNHVIVCVPQARDSIWLECTSQSSPFGYLGTFTGNRKALMITESGGVVVNTTQYPSSINVQSTRAEVSIDANGHGLAKIQTEYSGLQYENGGLDNLLNDQFDEQRKWVQQNTKIPSFDIVKFNFANQKARIPKAKVSLELGLPRLATVNGKRVFITPNLMNRITYVPERVEKRETDVVLRIGYTDYDTIRFSIPENLYPEHLPEPIRIASQFGEYEATFTMDQGSILYTRKMRREKGEYPASSYNDLITFYRNISKADNTKVVLLNKT